MREALNGTLTGRGGDDGCVCSLSPRSFHSLLLLLIIARSRCRVVRDERDARAVGPSAARKPQPQVGDRKKAGSALIPRSA